MFSWLIVKFSVWLRKLDRDSVECAINQLDMSDCDDVIIFVEWIAHTDWGKSSGIFHNFSCSAGFIQLTHWTLNSHRIEISSRVHCTIFDFIESLIHNRYYSAIFNLFLFFTQLVTVCRIFTKNSLSHFCHFQAPHEPSRELTDAPQSLIVSQTDSSTGGKETKKIRRFSAWSTPPYWAKGMKKHNSTRSAENRKFSEHNVNDWKVRKMFPSTWTNLCCVWMRFFLLVIFLFFLFSLSACLFPPPTPSQSSIWKFSMQFQQFLTVSSESHTFLQLHALQVCPISRLSHFSDRFAADFPRNYRKLSPPMSLSWWDSESHKTLESVSCKIFFEQNRTSENLKALSGILECFPALLLECKHDKRIFSNDPLEI